MLLGICKNYPKNHQIFNPFKMAEKSIRFYKNLPQIDEHNVLLEREMNKIRATLADNRIEYENRASIGWSDFTSKTSSKAIFIGIVLIVLNTYNGNITLSNYTKHIFEETGSNLSVDLSAIVTAVIQIVGVFIATQLVDRLGRKVHFASKSRSINFFENGFFSIIFPH